MRQFFLFSLLCLFIPILNYGQPKVETLPGPEIGIVEKLDEFIPEGIMIENENGDTVDLKSIINKPTAISLVYYRCPGICSPLMDGIAQVIDKTDLIIGEDYQVLTISFDPTESMEMGIKKKKNYLNLMIKKELANQSWQFFVTDSSNISKLTKAVGFKYKKTGNDFLHAATLIFISPEGKITRYLNGTYFLPFELKLALVEASQGISGPTMNKVLQYCYSYDPVGQKYVLNITKVAGIIIIFLALVIFLVLILGRRRPIKS
jgi:protein SCO1